MRNPERDLAAVLVTFPDEETAVEVARQLVERRLVACVNVLPGVRSVYRWEGAVQVDPEVLAILKTTTDRLEDLAAEVARLHPYDTPEFMALDPLHVDERYLRWARASVAPPEAPDGDPAP
ncbi:MAG: divalent-cation tolerance protein CutA [Planctomycetota bacterium]